MGTAVTSTDVGAGSKAGEHSVSAAPVEPVPDVDQPLVPSSLVAFTCTSYSVRAVSPEMVVVVARVDGFQPVQFGSPVLRYWTP